MKTQITAIILGILMVPSVASAATITDQNTLYIQSLVSAIAQLTFQVQMLQSQLSALQTVQAAQVAAKPAKPVVAMVPIFAKNANGYSITKCQLADVNSLSIDPRKKCVIAPTGSPKPYWIAVDRDL